MSCGTYVGVFWRPLYVICFGLMYLELIVMSFISSWPEVFGSTIGFSIFRCSVFYLEDKPLRCDPTDEDPEEKVTYH